MTYFLEKHYVLQADGTLDKALYGHMLVRPCNTDYKTVLKFLKGKLSKSFSLVLEGQIATFNENNGFGGTLSKKFNSLEEWLIWLELEKGITPDFEEVHIARYDDFTDFIVKTTDLHTHKVIYDSMDLTINKLKKEMNLDNDV